MTGLKGLRIISGDERLTYADMETLGYEIYYKRIPAPVRLEIVRRHTRTVKRGGEVTDWGAVSQECLEWGILGWSGVYDIVNGKRVDIDYGVEHVGYIPDEQQADLLDKMGANVERAERDIKNSSSTRSSKSSTKD